MPRFLQNEGSDFMGKWGCGNGRCLIGVAV